jgi:hypothetical protein
MLDLGVDAITDVAGISSASVKEVSCNPKLTLLLLLEP